VHGLAGPFETFEFSAIHPQLFHACTDLYATARLATLVPLEDPRREVRPPRDSPFRSV
jgi:hypothetical protein